MADENDDDQNGQDKSQQGKNKKQGDGVRIFISAAEDADGKAKEIVTHGSSSGKYNVLVRMGQNREKPTHAVSVKVFANETPIGIVKLVKEPNDFPFEDLKLDPSKEVTFSVRRTGQEKPDDSVPPINLTKVKRSEAASGKSKKRFEVIVGQLTPDRKNPVSIITYDDKDQMVQGTVVCSFGQDTKINGVDMSAGDPVTFITGDGVDNGHGVVKPLGMYSAKIQLKRVDETVEFTHLESREIIRKSLLKEP